MKQRPPETPLAPLAITGGILSLLALAGLCSSEWHTGEAASSIQAYFAENEPQTESRVALHLASAPAPEIQIISAPIASPELLLPEEWNDTEPEELPPPTPELPLVLATEILPALPVEPPQPPQPTRTSTPEAPPARLAPPVALHTPSPPYPPALRARRRSGSVQVRIHINRAGTPTAVEVLSATHPAFATATQQHILHHWRFSPARRGDTAVDSTAAQTVYFRI